MENIYAFGLLRGAGTERLVCLCVIICVFLILTPHTVINMFKNTYITFTHTLLSHVTLCLNMINKGK